MRKIYVVPNLVTTANLFFGFYSAIASIQGDFVIAAWAILGAGVCDALDGRIARLARATSPFGVQYDSMSDLVSFGMAPALLLFQWALTPFGRLGWMASFLFVTCGALRLARFNVTTHSIPKGYFQGLPIPMAAGVVATFIIFNNTLGWPDNTTEGLTHQIVALIFAFGLSTLMVSSIKFPSFKEFNWRSRVSFCYLLTGILSMILIASKPEIMFFLILCGYILISLGMNLFKMIKTETHTHEHPSS